MTVQNAPKAKVLHSSVNVGDNGSRAARVETQRGGANAAALRSRGLEISGARGCLRGNFLAGFLGFGCRSSDRVADLETGALSEVNNGQRTATAQVGYVRKTLIDPAWGTNALLRVPGVRANKSSKKCA
jgi:hypothetical protein